MATGGAMVNHEAMKPSILLNEHSDPSNLPLEQLDPVKEKEVFRKLDRRIVPTMMLLYLMSFMDRVNIGNARLYGLEDDLGMSGNQYQVAVSLLFVTYCLFEIPSNLVLEKFRPVRYLAGLTVIWGILATCCGVVQSYEGLLAVRVLLGLFEAGLFPGLVIYLSLFYTRRYIAVRTSLLLSTAAIAGAVGGLLAYAIGYMDGIAGLRAWRWIMILEGITTVILGLIVPFILPDTPERAKCLTTSDREFLVAFRSMETGQTAAAQKFQIEDLKKGVRDWKVYIMPVGHYCTNLMFYSFAVFLPTIIQDIGTWSVPEIQALTIPVYGTGALVYITMAFVSDRIQQRGLIAGSFLLIAILGYCLLIANINTSASFAGCFIVAIGCYTSTGIPLAWVVANQPRYAKRAFASGLQLTTGNSAGIAAPFLYSDAYAPLYRPGYGGNLALCALGAGVYFSMNFYYRRQNAKRARGDYDWRMEGKTQEEVDEMGDENPRFVYTT